MNILPCQFVIHNLNNFPKFHGIKLGKKTGNLVPVDPVSILYSFVLIILPHITEAFSQMQTNLSRSPKPQYFPSTMLPPPPLPPMARPVALIRSTVDASMTVGANSPPASITPPCSETSTAEDVPDISSSPPLSPGRHGDRRKSPSQRSSVPPTSPYSPNRDYFNHFHGQPPGHVGSMQG